jgi:hypothetical protein
MVEMPGEASTDLEVSGAEYEFVRGSTMAETPIETFTVYEVKGFKKRIPWTANLNPTQAEFICQETDRRLSVPREKARAEIRFLQTGVFFIMSEGTMAVVSKISFEFGGNKSRLERWFPPRTTSEMQKDLRGWGVGLIIVGVLSIILSQLLDPIWGVIIIILGIANLLIVNRSLFIINGLALIAVGIMNITSVCSAITSATYRSGSTIFTGFILLGIMQIAWGFQEIRKFGKYASVQ